MNSKFYVSLKAAKLLKKLGYNNYSTVYDCSVEGSMLLNQKPIYGEWAGDKDVYPCPTKSEAIDWLESKEIVVQAIPSTPNIWRWRMFSMKYIPYDDHTEDSEILYKTRLEAEDAVIIEGCKLLSKWRLERV